MAKIKISEECIGCGSCVSICEKTFELRGNKAIVKKQPEKITCEKDAADSCPVNAIKISG